MYKVYALVPQGEKIPTTVRIKVIKMKLLYEIYFDKLQGNGPQGELKMEVGATFSEVMDGKLIHSLTAGQLIRFVVILCYLSSN